MQEREPTWPPGLRERKGGRSGGVETQGLQVFSWGKDLGEALSMSVMVIGGGLVRWTHDSRDQTGHWSCLGDGGEETEDSGWAPVALGAWPGQADGRDGN